MFAIRVDPLTAAAHKDVLSLELAEFQRKFLPDVQSSIQMAAKYPSAKCVAIRDDRGVALGFALYGIDEVTSEWKIFRFMIDVKHQGNGYGKAALAVICDEMRSMYGAKSILVVFHEDNHQARNLYERFGFREYARDGVNVLARWGADSCGSS